MLRRNRVLMLAALTATMTLPSSAVLHAAPATEPVRAAAVAATPAPATAGAATRAFALDGTIIQPAAQCQWGDLLNIALRGGKLEVKTRPPREIATPLAARKLIDVEITNAIDKYWRLQGIAPQPPGGVAVGAGGQILVAGGVRIRIGGPVRAAPVVPAPVARRPAGGGVGSAAAADADNLDFTATAHGRARPTDGPRLGRIMVMNGSFQLRGRWLRDSKTYQIDFRSYTDKTNVTLNVREFVRGRGLVVLTMEAADLQQIRHDRPLEVRTYLEPLLTELCDGRNPLRPQAGDVYRAFALIPADYAATERVRRIVEAFDALEPAVRDAASAQLNQLAGRAEVLAAARLDRTELSPEQTLRLDTFLLRNSAMKDIAAARRDRLFLIDCLEDEDSAVRAAALTALREVVGHDIDFDVDAPAEQRATDAEALESQLVAPPPPPPAPTTSATSKNSD